MFLSACWLLALVCIICWLWKRKQMYWLSLKCDGPFALPFIGSAWILIKADDNLQILDEFGKKYTSPVRFWAGTSLFLIIFDLEDVETILKNPQTIRRMNIYKFIRQAISTKAEGLFTCDSIEWKYHRRFVGQSFGQQAMISNIPVQNKHARILILNLSNKIGKGTFDVRLIITRTTLDMFLESILGAEFGLDEKKTYINYLTNGQSLVSKRIFFPLFHNDFLWNLTGYSKLLKKYTAYASYLTDKIMHSNLSLKKNSNSTFIERLMRISEQNEEHFSFEDVKAEVTTLTMGGSDTTALTASFIILLLAMHPCYQEKCYKELQNILPKKDTIFTSDMITQIPYTEMCIKESMRLFPVVPVIGRSPQYSIKLKNITLPPNQSVIIPIRSLMRKPEYFGIDADKFNPEHCSLENLALIPAHAYLPFSFGPRNCIAYKYAYIVLKLLIAQTIRNYRFTTPLKFEELKVRVNVNACLLNNHMVEVHSRAE